MQKSWLENLPSEGYLRPSMDPWTFTIQVYTLGLSPPIMPTATLSTKGILCHKPLGAPLFRPKIRYWFVSSKSLDLKPRG